MIITKRREEISHDNKKKRGDITCKLQKPTGVDCDVKFCVTGNYAVAHWNAYFNAMMYLTDQELAPLQLVLRDILVSNTISLSDIADEETMRARQGIAELMKFSLIVISSLPVMVIYPFIQKYFVQGVMLGSIKG